MKNILRTCILFSIILLAFGCSNNKIDVPNENEYLEGIDNSNNIVDLPNEDENSKSIDYFNDIMNSPINDIDWEDTFKKVNFDDYNSNFTILGQIGENYYGLESELDEDTNRIIDTEILINPIEKEIISYNYPENLPKWQVGSGSTIELQNHYLYEWRSYTSQFSGETEHDMKLTRIDSRTGEVEVIDEIKLNLPFIYLCKIDEETFISYYVIQSPSDKVEYATLTVATLYSIDGTKTEIIREKYENDVNWIDSEGILIERFAVKDGKIYGFGRRQISAEYKFFLYHYDRNGNILETEELQGFEKIIGNEQPLELFLVNDFIIFRTYESLTNYICKKEESKIELIMKGSQASILYAISNDYIFFIENNVDGESDTVKEKEIPLYAIKIKSGKIKTINFPVPLENPYFVDFRALSNDDLLATYCEGGRYDPLNLIQFILPCDKVNSLLSSVE